MADFLRYVLSELKAQRLSKSMGLELIRQYHERAVHVAPALHPLLQSNMSEFAGQRYRSVFSGEEFFLRDHVVQQESILPGVAALEMARAAASQSSHTRCIGMKNVVWARPIVVGDVPVEVNVTLRPNSHGEITYEVCEAAASGAGEAIVHSQGVALVGNAREPEYVDITKYRLSCNQGNLTSVQCYSFYESLGLSYGASHRSIEEIYFGAGELLAKLRLPDIVLESEKQYVLHPSMMDGALQAALSLMHAEGRRGSLEPVKLTVPFAMDELEIFNPCSAEMWVVINHVTDSQISNKVEKLDIAMCDVDGKVCVRLKGFSSRTVEVHHDEPHSAPLGLLVLAPSWKKQPLALDVIIPHVAQHVVIICGIEGADIAEIEKEIPGVRCIQLPSIPNGLALEFNNCARIILQEFQRAAKANAVNSVLFIQLVVPASGTGYLLSGFSGFLKAAHRENPHWLGQVVCVDPTEGTQALATQLRLNCSAPLDQDVLYRANLRYTREWTEIPSLSTLEKPWKDEGVYLITGGAGGLGLIAAREIAEQTRGAVLILVGRSLPTESQHDQMRQLEQLGAKVVCRQLDVSEIIAVCQLVEAMVLEFGTLNGILHCAGVLRDGYVIHKKMNEVEQVFAPKVSGLINIDIACSELHLDFFILYSSRSGVHGNAGQTDYAAASAFMDAYADYRNTLVADGQRHGHTLSINWPLWADGGMGVHVEIAQDRLQKTGMALMQTSTGIEALYRAWSSRENQILVLEGQLARLSEMFALYSETPTTASRTSPESAKNKISIEPDILQEKAEIYFKKVLSKALKFPVHRIDANAPMEQYGIDSIMVMKLTNELEEIFGSLSKTLFFEYQTIRNLTRYFCAAYEEKLAILLEIGPEFENSVKKEHYPSLETQNHSESMIIGSKNSQLENPKKSSTIGGDSLPSPAADIAIIGLSGRYPKAGNIAEYWTNLTGGIDCITEIPSDRWDYKNYFDQDKNKQDKAYSKWGGFIEGVDEFDPLFFNIAPIHAAQIDPQSRLFLQSAFETVEDAGYTRETLGANRNLGLNGNVGVFVGVMYQEYQLYGAQAQALSRPFAVSGSASSIANRVSYFFNLHGPSLAIDTMCSSSLTALHLACESLQRGECQVALAGGVNVSIHPNKYLYLSQSKFLSSKGRCEAFGEGGEGYVPAEGVGSVLLKPLSQAVADGDHIYGVIKATAINHGGKTNGYTVPNPRSQGHVINDALRRAGINPRTISYIEAHGTGTSLGDPIEIAGLSSVFQRSSSDTQYCAIGSVKSNIGHCESAAGIAGLTKVLLQMRHGQLVPSLHSKILNPHIDFSNSPFFVQQELAEWKRPVIESNGKVKEYPRIAGISSFGAGGSNSHVIVQEYIPEKLPGATGLSVPFHPALIVLSAKNEEQLLEQVRRLLIALASPSMAEVEISKIAFTLQVGREALDERLAIIVSSKEELQEKLHRFIEGAGDVQDLFRGNIAKNNVFSQFIDDEGANSAVAIWIKKKSYGKLLDLWVRGFSFDWNLLYGASYPSRISLPTYPFARDRYWIPMDWQRPHGLDHLGVSPILHPLVHRNTSDLFGLRFSSIFSGDEPFLVDHIVNGARMLPGAAYLEMACAAVKAVTLPEDGGTISVSLENVVWARPIVVDHRPIQLFVYLNPMESGEIAFEIHSDLAVEEGDTFLHSQGVAKIKTLTKAEVIDIVTIRENCNVTYLNGAQCYDKFRKRGIEYGDAHRVIEELFIGQSSVLAKLVLPSALAHTLHQYSVHPSLLDGALQASLGLSIQAGDQLSLPFALQKFEILGLCTHVMWAVLSYSEGSVAGDNVRKLDIDLLNDTGQRCMHLHGFTSRVLPTDLARMPAGKIGTLMLRPLWNIQAAGQQVALSSFAQHLVMLCDINEISPQDVMERMVDVRCLALYPIDGGIDENFGRYANAILNEIQNAFKMPPNGNVLIQVVVPLTCGKSVMTGLAGMLKTMRLENPRFVGQMISVSPIDTYGLTEVLLSNSFMPADQDIRYVDGLREVLGWSEIELLDKIASYPWKDGGVYLITGGTGELGRIFASELARRTTRSVVILTGRTGLNEEKEELLENLGGLGIQVLYRVIDVSDASAVAGLIDSIVDQYGRLNGVIHSAGIHRDGFILKKSLEQFNEVLQPKVSGLVNLDVATQDVSLDFLICFSSVSGVRGNVGQVDYAVANAFMDAYVVYRNSLVKIGQRNGRTISVNWPLWAEGGMHMDAATQRKKFEESGVVAMSTSAGIEALYHAWDSGFDQVMIVEGNISRLREVFIADLPTSLSTAPATIDRLGMHLGAALSQMPSLVQTSAAKASDVLADKAVGHLVKLLAQSLHLPQQRIDAQAELETYGMDSVLAMTLTSMLEQTFGTLPKTLFFEYQSIDLLAAYFLEHHRPQLVELLGLDAIAPVPQQPVFKPELPAMTSSSRRSRQRFAAVQAPAQMAGALDIAIIGISGSYPKASTLQQYWSNLLQGVDCISEIPAERWDADAYFDAERGQTGKSYSKWGGFIDGVDCFDPLFFNISPREAEKMDPQERLFLQCVYGAMEDAGYTKEVLGHKHRDLGLGGNVGVFVGVMYEEYQLYAAQAQMTEKPLTVSGIASSIANRVSYFCNFHGPSLAINTMCSSSLTAIHLASQSLLRGNCEVAIAGGVNVTIHPNKYLLLSGGQFASSEGLCRSFGDGGDGYVPGEGVGAVLLKPLAKAIADGDQIYGVIKGSAINHGGKTNGYTVPNPNAQAQVIAQALKESGVHPRTISYIEAHGTGTALGDPIEIAGLSKAFGVQTEDRQYCAIGSAKSNIGHCESAAGIAGLTKVLLQMKHRTLVKSLHSEVLNPNIDFGKTPFVVQQANGPWERPVLTIDGQKREYPRIAGISSFGAGGANAHLIVEEYIAPERVANTTATPQPAMVVLSAKNKARLKEQVLQLLEAITSIGLRDANLADVAYTLQVGREAMEVRLGCVVGSLDELRNKLESYLKGERDIDELYVGEVKSNKDVLDVFSDKEMQEAIVKWMQLGKVSKLLDLWVKGLQFDWDGLHGAIKPQRISLPTYPFAKERYWLPEPERARGSGVVLPVAVLHPLLHRNTSDLDEQRFSSVFTGEEFFLRDHVVQGRKVLPGAAHLELARAAVQRAVGEQDAQKAVRLEGVVFARPVVLGDMPVELHIALMAEVDGAIAFEIYSIEEGVVVVHSQGRAVLAAQAAVPPLDLSALKAQCTEHSVAASACYAAFVKRGLVYGKTFQGIECIDRGRDGAGAVLALGKLSLPGDMAGALDAYVLHPSLLDAALQSSIGLVLGDNAGEDKLALPFAVEQLEIFGPLEAKMWAVVRYAKGSGPQSAVRKLDIDIADVQGRVCVRLKGISSRVVESTPGGVSTGSLLLEPHWVAESLPTPAGGVVQAQRQAHWVMLCEAAPDVQSHIEAQMEQTGCVRLSTQETTLVGRYTAYAKQLLHHVKTILQERPKGDVLVQVVVPGGGEGMLFSGLGGLLKSAQKENPRLLGQMLAVDDGVTMHALVARLKDEVYDAVAPDVRYLGEERQVLRLKEVSMQANAPIHRWKDGGVYLITGGAGGLGRVFATEIARQVKRPVLVLTGRAAQDAEKEALVAELERLGARTRYRAVDMSNADAVAGLIDGVVDEFGNLNGILHSAGVVRDSLLLNKTDGELQEVFAAKVAGLVALDEATAELDLDCFVMFSSVASVMGNAGQADYAAANGFMDVYARYRNTLVGAGKRRGHTLTVNWPLWATGGMQVDVSVRERMWRMGGLMPLESEAGILALHQGLAQAGSQLVVLTGDVARIRERLDTETKSARQAMQLPAAPAAELNDVLADKAVRHLVKLLAQGLHLPQQRIDAQAELETYGMDSVLAMTLTSMLEQTFGTLPKTLFFEYQSIDLLAAYFLEHHRPQLVELLGLDAIAPVPQQPVFKPELPAMTSSSRRSRQRFAAVQAPAQMAGALDIAIIGISGSYPKASTLQQYWSNLLQGVDCISEIPAERWDADAYFDAERGQTGKSYSKWGGFIDGVDCFDPLFFNISPREAEKMDPQERLFLQCVYGAMEDAGYTKEVLGHKHRDLGLGGNVGVFVGVMYEEYQLYAAQAQMTEKPLTVSGIASSIANRVSYFCNFHGPSLAINTMCSSSLTAIHLASQSLLRGNCEVAIAGGVNVTIHPNKYLLLSGGQFASSEGLCRSFGDGGDGYVPGEGVGAVLLKPLAKAIADGDQIYGVIKGSAINHGGKTNGYTVPNPNAQAQVIAQALKESGVHPRTISYIEAHGTGTALGDPIEIAGLSKAFGVQTEDRQYCAIGSAKSNIGHCESAAGIAGLTKVLLQMKHRTLVKSLHSEVLNPNIDFGKTPFVVQQANGPWERPVLTIDGQKREYPRIAGISSFGAGGANAHLIVEEYIAPERVANTTATPQPAMVVLSAKNEARLKEQVLQLLEAITSIGLRDANLADVAYTLQVGREAMEVRLGCVVGSLDELRNKLESYLKGERDIDELYVGEVKSNKDVLDVFSDKEMQEAIVKWMQLGKVSKLLDLWVKGLQFDWDGLHGAIKPQRISLPTYPFAKERYWLPEPERARGSGVVLPVAVLHPLLHRNTSDLDEQRFSSVFTGEEFFLRDHVVQGRKVLPGAAHLELARAAVQRAVGEQDAQKAVRLEGVVFARPVVLGDMPVELHIALMAEVDGAIAFEIYSIEEGVVVVHSQGRAVLAAQAAVPPLDLSALKAQCTEHSVAASACYAAFVKRGLVYGKTFQGIECIDRGRDGAGAVLALGKLSLPGDMAGALDAYVLHPSLLDAALQSSIGLVLGDNAGEDKLALPFAVEQLEIFGPLEAKMWAVVRYAKGSGPQSAVRKLDIDIADVQGRVCVRLKGISSRVVESTPGGVSTGSLLLEPHWVAESLPTPAGGVVQAQRQAHWVMLCEAAPDVQSHIEAQMEQTGCVRLSTQETTLVGRYTAYAKQLLHHVKTILQERPKGDVLVQVVVPGGGEGMLFSGLGGLLKSAQKENPRLLGQMLAVDDGVTMHALVARLKDEVYDAVAPDVRYLGEERQVLRLKEVSMQANAPIHRWKDGGVYLITGGAGGLGRVFATEIARQVKRPVLVLTGRAAQDAEKEALVAELERLGARTRYRAVDMSNADAVAGLIDGVVDEFGNLNGILHSAGVVRDSLLLNKTDGELQEVFAAKVAGLVALDEATAELDLDCFVMFSSVASVMGNAGQADYAAANGFMDVYARYRNTLVGAGKRRGHTLTVNWPLWATGGMQVDVSVRERMWRMGGLMPLESEAGILALHQGLAQAGSQLVVLTGDVARIRERLDTETKSARQAMQLPAAPAVAADVASLRREVQAALVLEVAQLLLIKREDIDIDVELTLFGFDSISMMELGSVLAKKFGIALSPTVFFEYTTLERLSDYLVLEHGDVLAKYFVISGHSPGVPVHVPQAQLETATTQRLGRRRSRVGEAPSGEQTTSGIAEAVAIIGVSGTFPQSGNLDALWENLKAGHDCISEMPHERWSESSGIEIRRVGVIEEIDQFDPLFFGISPREAEGMDPQQRLLMTYAWKAIEDAGYAAKHLSGSKTAILVGAGNSGYGALLAQKAGDSIEGFSAIGMMASMGPARMSYLLNLHGPSESINTACSSSLVAVHRAIMMMNAGECDMAIVGGVNSLLSAELHISFTKAGMLSKDGRCKTFSSQADGYARGEGVGMLLLKKLSAAERDGDHIYGLIRGTAENHGGRASSLTAPNPRAQADLIKAAFGRAGVDPRTVSYIETHGTGTSLGDPIEIQGLKSAFKELSEAQHRDGEAPPAGYCGLGAVKSNIGHLELAAGVAGIIKVLLQLKHKTLVKSLHCEEVNPYIDLAGSPFYIVQKTQPWVAQTDEKGQALPRRAGVSSFGIGGVNAHVVLEEYIAQERVANTATPQRAMVVLSAKNEVRLKEQVSQLLEAITSSGLRDADLADVAYTLQVGREAMEVRLGCVVGSLEELRSKLERYVKGERDIDALYLGEVKRHKAFAADEEMLTTIDEWVAQGKCDKLLDLWVKGLQFEWAALYKAEL